jgi:hypothetical protein
VASRRQPGRPHRPPTILQTERRQVRGGADRSDSPGCRTDSPVNATVTKATWPLCLPVRATLQPDASHPSFCNNTSDQRAHTVRTPDETTLTANRRR